MDLKWETAYYWPDKKTVTVGHVLKLREAGRLEAGHCWCHQACYDAKPRRGCSLGPKKRSINGRRPHFSRGRGKGGTRKVDDDCEYDLIRQTKQESFRYSQFYHDLRAWLKTKEAESLLKFSSFVEHKSTKYSDFEIIHGNEEVPWDETIIIIVHKNRSRVSSNQNHMIIDLSQWKLDHLSNFTKYGKRKVCEEFQQLEARMETFLVSKRNEALTIIDRNKTFTEILDGMIEKNRNLENAMDTLIKKLYELPQSKLEQGLIDIRFLRNGRLDESLSSLSDNLNDFNIDALDNFEITEEGEWLSTRAHASSTTSAEISYRSEKFTLTQFSIRGRRGFGVSIHVNVYMKPYIQPEKYGDFSYIEYEILKRIEYMKIITEDRDLDDEFQNYKEHKKALEKAEKELQYRLKQYDLGTLNQYELFMFVNDEKPTLERQITYYKNSIDKFIHSFSKLGTHKKFDIEIFVEDFRNLNKQKRKQLLELATKPSATFDDESAGVGGFVE